MPNHSRIRSRNAIDVFSMVINMHQKDLIHLFGLMMEFLVHLQLSHCVMIHVLGLMMEFVMMVVQALYMISVL